VSLSREKSREISRLCPVGQAKDFAEVEGGGVFKSLRAGNPFKLLGKKEAGEGKRLRQEDPALLGSSPLRSGYSGPPKKEMGDGNTTRRGSGVRGQEGASVSVKTGL